MTHVVLQHCCADARCVEACPVDCIHPAPGEPNYGSTDTVFIDPAVCIDCGACADVCPVGAVVPDYDLPATQATMKAMNREYYDSAPCHVSPPRRRPDRPLLAARLPRADPAIRVAIVGAGASGWYAAEHLLANRRAKVEIAMIDRDDRIGGLARYGVAPDHAATREILRHFASIARDERVSLHLGVSAGGPGYSQQELLARFHAVIYATGAAQDKRSDVAGSELPGCWGAAQFVRWYNGHPSLASAEVDLSSPAAVVIGNGNVALDVARMLLTSPRSLSRLDLASHACAAVSESRIRRVVVLGRRGAEHAAFTRAELSGILTHTDFTLRVDANELPPESASRQHSSATAAKLAMLHETALQASSRAQVERVLELRFGWSLVEILGAHRVQAARFSSHGTSRHSTLTIDTSLVVRATGLVGAALSGVPFDSATGTIPTVAGRVLDPVTGIPVRGAYATGWVASGASGNLGHNRERARATVAALIEDLVDGRLHA
jgi:ferredoxin--NADP+ reductase